MKLRAKRHKLADEKYLLWVKQSEEGSPAKSFSTLLAAAKLGSERAQVEIGYDYAYGTTGGADRAKALYWWKRAYKQGSWDAAFNLGAYFRDAREWKRAVKWFERAVEAGDDDGLVEIAKVHLRYDGDRAEGIRFLTLAKASKRRLTQPERKKLEGMLDEQSRLTPGDLIYMEAERLNESGRYSDAYPLLAKGAGLGDESCQILLGNYLTGKMRGVRADREEGIFWYKIAYENGSTVAAENLALTYLKEKNVDEAFRWYERSAALGSGSAHLALAKIWLRHRGDARKALDHLKAMFDGPRSYSDAEEDEARSMLRRLGKQTHRRG